MTNLISAITYLMIGTSPDPAYTQTMTAVRYGSMRECLRAVAQIVLAPTTNQPVTLVVRPYCTDVKPSFWVERGQ